MREIDIVRAWKDAEYRASLSADELATLPESPIGNLDLDLTDAELELIAGGEDDCEPIEGDAALAACAAGTWSKKCIIGTITGVSVAVCEPIYSALACPATSRNCPTYPNGGCPATHPVQPTCNNMADPLCPKKVESVDVL
jgi:mersacidin/lichenicidin family type 2 lantibiotic